MACFKYRTMSRLWWWTLYDENIYKAEKARNTFLKYFYWLITQIPLFLLVKAFFKHLKKVSLNLNYGMSTIFVWCLDFIK